jgi:hypothetical protein
MGGDNSSTQGNSNASWSPNSWGTTDPETGNANSPIGRFFQGAFGKRGPTTAQLPAGLSWVNDFAGNLAQGAPVNYNASTAAEGAGVAGSNALGMTATGTMPGTAAAWNAGLGGLGQGLQTGFMPDLGQIDAILRPGLERSFASGAADIREQNALTGGLSSSGAGQQMVDYRTQLENSLNNQVSNIYGNALPTSINARAGLTNTALGLPGQNASQIYGPAAGLGIAGEDQVLNAIRTAFGAIGSSPYTGQQGSGGSGGGGALAGLAKGCWVAEAIFGVDALETHLARHYVNHLAPCEFRDWYLANGEELASRVRMDAALKSRLRPLFIDMACRVMRSKLPISA